jgi:hypothetical protein
MKSYGEKGKITSNSGRYIDRGHSMQEYRVNLLVPNVDLSWRAVKVFKSATQPNVDLTWREYVSNLEGLCSHLHVT